MVVNNAPASNTTLHQNSVCKSGQEEESVEGAQVLKQGEVLSVFLSLPAWALERGGLQSCGADAELEVFTGCRVEADPNGDE